MDGLDERDLKWVVAELREEAEDRCEKVDSPIWLGLAAAAEKRLDVLKARRSTKGKWYAVAEFTVWETGNRAGRHDILEEVECNGRKAAVTAARELLKKHAHYFDERTTIEANIYPEIEWQQFRGLD